MDTNTYLGCFAFVIAVCMKLAGSMQDVRWEPEDLPDDPQNVAPPAFWSPPLGYDGTAEDYYTRRGIPVDQYEEYYNNVIEIKRYFYEENGIPFPDEALNVFFGGFLLTLNQADRMLQQVRQQHQMHHRVKRKILPYDLFPQSKWTMPVYYQFDGSHDNKEKSTIREAIRRWEDKTCVRFQEISEHSTNGNLSRLVFQSKDSGCWSFPGKLRESGPQPINLADTCLQEVGTTIHEIGHALGLLHEQSRVDSSQYIQIYMDNIRSGSELNFKIKTVSRDLGVPYDYASIMQYHAMAYSSNEEYTILPHNSMFTRTLGQRRELSFNDAKIVNLEYCNDSCNVDFCEYPAYPDPENCSRCICMTGSGGIYCNETAQSSPECVSNGTFEIEVSSEDYHCLESPGYSNGSSYPEMIECNWKLQTQEGDRIEVYFEDRFDLYCVYPDTHPICYHWVEIRYQQNPGMHGPRFCCNDRQLFNENTTLLSDGHVIDVLFDSKHVTTEAHEGFRLCYRKVPVVSKVQEQTATFTENGVTSGPSSSITFEMTSQIISAIQTTPRQPGGIDVDPGSTITNYVATLGPEVDMHSIQLRPGEGYEYCEVVEDYVECDGEPSEVDVIQTQTLECTKQYTNGGPAECFEAVHIRDCIICDRVVMVDTCAFSMFGECIEFSSDPVVVTRYCNDPLYAPDEYSERYITAVYPC